MSIERKTLKKINENELKSVAGASIANGGNYWKVIDESTGKTIGRYENKKFAKWADEQYKSEGKISFFGYIK